MQTNKILGKLSRTALEAGIHGLCFSPYEEGQKPGDVLSVNQIRRRLNLIRPYTSWVRSFSCTEGNEEIPRIAKEMGFKTLVGCWLGSDREKNAIEMDGLAQLCREGVVNIASVGNEVLYRGDLLEDDLLAYMEEARYSAAPYPLGMSTRTMSLSTGPDWSMHQMWYWPTAIPSGRNAIRTIP